jgi:Bacterial proteasome activator
MTPIEPFQPSEATDGERRDESVAPVEHGEIVTRVGPDDDAEAPPESVTEPAKVMRIGSMVKQLLEEVRQAPLDEASRGRLASIYARSIDELSSALSPDLGEELRSLALPIGDAAGPPSDAELRIAQAQLVGWLEGLFHGIQATLFAQQLAARQQLEQMRQLPPGPDGRPGPGDRPGERPGTYL